MGEVPLYGRCSLLQRLSVQIGIKEVVCKAVGEIFFWLGFALDPLRNTLVARPDVTDEYLRRQPIRFPVLANHRGTSPIRKRLPPQDPPRTLGIGNGRVLGGVVLL